MRRRYLVAYDIRDDRRLRHTRRVMMGFGDPMQFSGFLCDLSNRERVLLRTALAGVIDHRADSIIIIDLGAVVSRLEDRWERMGVGPLPPERTAVIV